MVAATSKPGHRPERTSLEGVETEAFLHVQVAEHASGEEAESERDEPDHHRPERPDLLQSSECRLDGHHVLLLVLLEHLAEDGTHLLLSAAGLRDLEGEEGEDQDGNAEDEVRPSPPLHAAGDRRDDTDQQRARDSYHGADRHRRRAHPPSNGDRVGVGEQRAVDRAGVRLRDTHPEAGQEEGERVHGEATEEDHDGEGETGEADDARPPAPVRQVPHRQRPEHQERARGGGDEGDDTVGDAEGVSNVGSEDAQRGVLEFVEAVQQQQDRERERATAQQTLLEGHRLLADSGERVVVEEQVSLERLGGLAVSLRVEDARRHCGERPLGSRGTLGHGAIFRHEAGPRVVRVSPRSCRRPVPGPTSRCTAADRRPRSAVAHS